MSLRLRLLAVTLTLLAAGLAVAGFATYAALDAFLVERVDQQLRDARAAAIAVVDPAGESARPGPSTPRARPPILPVGSWVEVRDAEGGVTTYASDSASAGEPELPDDIPSTPFDTPSSEGGAGYRSLAFADQPRPGSTMVVSIPRTEVARTLDRVVVVELAVAGGVILLVGALAFWLVRVGLRPLSRIEETAGAIADGDLSRRVERDDPRTEVGRLGRALNAMLGQIERAFAERRASEDRLRRFVSDASHELRTPLASVRGYAELFRRGAADRPEDLAQVMRRIEEESERMGVLVDDLLLLARLDEGRPLERDSLDLTALVRDAVSDARVAAPERDIALQADDSIEIVGDAQRLRQVLANLLTNARVHTPDDATIRVVVRREDESAVLEVVDDGPGLDPEVAEHVFERFYRADASRARASGGSGLGLSIVAGIVEAHGGRVGVESEPGRGATFRVTLPIG